MTKNFGGPGQEGAPAGVPRWVKVAGIIAAVVIALLVILLVFGDGKHGPGRHMSGLGVTAPSPAAAWQVAQA